MAVTKPVSFKETEQDLLEYTADKSFSYYVKELIREDMNIKKGLVVKEYNNNKANKKRIIDYDI